MARRHVFNVFKDVQYVSTLQAVRAATLAFSIIHHLFNALNVSITAGVATHHQPVKNASSGIIFPQTLLASNLSRIAQ